MGFRRMAYFLIGIMFIYFMPCHGQWIAQGEILRDVYGPIEGEIIIRDENHGAIVFWVDGRLGTPAIWGQKVDSAGYQLWNPGGNFVALASFFDGDRYAASDGQGGAFIVWDNYRVNPISDIYAQHIDADGNLLWSDTGIAVTNWPQYEQWGATIISDEVGGAVIAWIGDSIGIDRIVAQRLDRHGTKLWRPGGVVLTDQTGLQREPIIGCLRDSGFVCIWSDGRQTGQGGGLYAQKINLEGNILWGNGGSAVAIAPALVRGGYSIAPDSNNGFYCVWHDGRNSGFDNKIFMQYVDSSGDFRLGLGGFEISRGSSNYNPFIALGPGNRAIVIWLKDLENVIYANAYDCIGQSIWPANMAILDNVVWNWGLACSDNQNFEIIANSMQSPFLRAQKVSIVHGNLIFGTEGRGFGVDEQMGFMASSSDSEGGIIVITKAHNAGPLRIHRIYRNGHIGGDSTSIDHDNKPSGFGLSISNYPNPFNEATSIIIESPMATNANIFIYDILGKKVTDLYRGPLPQGNSRILLDSNRLSHLSSGNYFICIDAGHQMISRKMTYLK